MKNQRKKDLTWEFPVEFMARILQVSVSGFYDYLSRKPSPAAIRRTELTLVVKDIFKEYDSIAGYRKIHEACERKNIVISKDMVKSIMHENHWYSVLDITPRWGLTRQEGTSRHIHDLVKRDFTSNVPGAKLVGDITGGPPAATLA